MFHVEVDDMSKKMVFDFVEISKETAWLLGFIYSDSTIGVHQGKTIIRLYNKNRELLENIKEYFSIPYKVTEQVNQDATLHFIRFSDPDFVESIESYGFAKDRSTLSVPDMDDDCKKYFICGFIQGKGSFYKEENIRNYGFKIVYRSESFVTELADYISQFCGVKIAKPHCRMIKNHVSCELKYSGKECDKIKEFIYSNYLFLGGEEFPDNYEEITSPIWVR